MIYWVTNSITSSFRIYRESFGPPQGIYTWMQSFQVDIPTGYALSRADLGNGVSRSLMSYYYTNLTLWTIIPSGGHFLALEEPDILVTEVRKFYHTIQPSSRTALQKEEL